MRLAFDMLGVPYRYVTGYRSSPPRGWRCSAARSISSRRSPPSYLSMVEPSMVKTGQVIPVYLRSELQRPRASACRRSWRALPILPFHELYRKMKGTMPSGQLWDVYRSQPRVDSAIVCA